MRVLLVTSPNEKCGIREHSEMLREAALSVSFDLVSPEEPWTMHERYDIVHIDHHAALHASYTPEVIEIMRKRASDYDVKAVVLTQHDTYETLDIMRERGLHDFHEFVDALIVHEPVEGLTDQGYDNVYYWRQPVPELPCNVDDWPSPAGYVKSMDDSPVVGTVGFDFPWKGFAQLGRCAEKAGWKTRVFGGTERWLSRSELLRELRRCDATAFLYETANSGTSAAIRVGIAARRPVIAYGCRQFRDLADERAILWAPDEQQVVHWLISLSRFLARARKTEQVEELADRDSWTNAGRRYAALYQRLSS